MITVSAHGRSWTTAIAELPRSTRGGDAVAAAIVVIDGAPGWGSRLSRAREEGATAIVLDDPVSISPDEVREARRTDGGAPVIVHRPRIRADEAARVTALGASLIEIHASSPSGDVARVLLDSVGWGRTLAGGELTARSARQTPRGFIALLEGSGVTVTVVLSRRDGPAPWLRVSALAAERIEIEVDGSAGSITTTRATAAGVLRLPILVETRERMSLRRAIAALDSEAIPTDLDDLEHDSLHTDTLLDLAREE